MTKDQLESALYERMFAENEAFLADMRTKPVDEVVSRANEIARRDNFLMLFVEETSLNQQQLEVLMEFDHPLSVLYKDSRHRNTGEWDYLQGCMKSFSNDILRKRAEQKYRDPAQPMLRKSWEEACFCDELIEWQADHHRSVECARIFQAEAEPTYREKTFSAFLRSWENTFGKERCIFVLDSTMRWRRDGDKCSSLSKVDYKAQLERTENRIDDYLVKTDLFIVKVAMEYLARRERSKEKTAEQRKQSQPER